MLTPIAPAHLTRITEIHSRAFPDSALNLLGNEAVRRYYAWQLLGPHDAVAVAVESDGALLGYCFGGVFRGSLSGFMKRNAFHLFWALLKRPSIWIAPAIRGRVRKGLKALLRPQRAASVARTPGRPFGILAIAVDPTHGRSGIGRSLMEHMEAAAVARGFKSMRLSVSPANAPAVRFYEGLGWRRDPANGEWKGRMIKLLPSASAVRAPAELVP